MSYHVRTRQAQTRRAEAAGYARGVLALILITAFLAALWFVFITALADQVGAGYDSEQNQPGYWGEDCTKTEQGLQGPRWYTPVDEGYTLVVLKSGTTNDVFTDVPADTQLSTVSGKDISHVIYCRPTTPPTTTTEVPDVTTTTAGPPPSVPPTTTTAGPPGTTTVAPPEEDEPGWDCETMGNRRCGPPPCDPVIVLDDGTLACIGEPKLAPPAVPVPFTPQFTG